MVGFCQWELSNIAKAKSEYFALRLCKIIK